MRQYYIGVGVFRQLAGALVCFLLWLLCVAVVLELDKHSITAVIFAGIGALAFLYLCVGALINAWRVAAAKFRIFFWWGS